MQHLPIASKRIGSGSVPDVISKMELPTLMSEGQHVKLDIVSYFTQMKIRIRISKNRCFQIIKSAGWDEEFYGKSKSSLKKHTFKSSIHFLTNIFDSASLFRIYQLLRLGRIWHKVNFLVEFNRFEFRVFLLD